jgi:hypothetical protein
MRDAWSNGALVFADAGPGVRGIFPETLESTTGAKIAGG